MDHFKVIGTVAIGVVIAWWLMSEPEDNQPITAVSSTAEAVTGEPEPPPRDEAASEPAPEPPEASPPPTPRSPWRVNVNTSPMDDSRSVFLSTPSNERIPGRFGRSAGNATLFVRCMENTTSLILQMNGNHMASSPYHNWGHVQMRIDDKPAFTREMSASTNHESLGLWRGNQSIPVIRQMFGAERLTVRATPFSESPITMTFNIRQLEDEIGPLRESCNW
ncbi:hypothetical protein CLM76_09250 [Vreelandella venusta]|nr:hypothetical protein CLM76_09250 [Halomonas hydrothermalis]